MIRIFNRYSLSCNFLSLVSRKYKNVLFFNSIQKVRNIYSKNKNGEVFDIAIVGGGMVGTTLACAIANNKRLESKKILLLEENNKHKFEFNDQYSNRVIVLNKHSQLLLSNIGVWKYIESVRFTPIYKMQVWDACSNATIIFNENNSLQELACVVETDLLLHAVFTELTKKKSVTVYNNAKIKHIFLSNKVGFNSEVHLESGEKFVVRLLIGADGQKSKVRQMMNIQYINWDYDQMGIVATVKLSKVSKNIVAWQKFLPTGTIALLPLTDSLSSLVWCIKTTEAKQLLKVSEEEFTHNVNDQFCKVYPKNSVTKGGMKIFQILLENFQLQSQIGTQMQPSIVSIVEGSRIAFPLGFGHAVHYVKPGVALIGDSAHRINPLAGQGVNLGFGDITALVEILAETVNNGASIEDISYLHKYESIRQKHNIPTLLAIDVLYRLYKETTLPIILARSIGLQLTNAINPAKDFLMKSATNSESIYK